VLAVLEKEGYQPEILIAGERTEESGTGLWGQVCLENRGVARFCVTASGVRGHSGMASSAADLTQKLVEARNFLVEISPRHLSLNAKSDWRSQIRFPFIQVGTPDVYNITPDFGLLGVEIRAVPGDRLENLMEEFRIYARTNGLELRDAIIEPGSACSPRNAYLERLLAAVRQESGTEPVLGRKLAGTSARYGPGGAGIVWGQSGIGPHSAEERHYIPSIEPYYRALNTFGMMTTAKGEKI